MARLRKPVKKHLLAGGIALVVVLVEVRAFLTVLDWADSASLNVGDQAFLLSLTAIVLAPPIGIVFVWLLEHS